MTNQETRRYRLTKTERGLFSGCTHSYDCEGTLDELTAMFRFKLETGAYYSYEPGNKKICLNPRSMADLISNLEKAADNASGCKFSGISYTYEEI